MAPMPEMAHHIPRDAQHQERWANGAGTATVILREPDDADWRVRISVARVDAEGPFSPLAGVRRTLVPLDAPMALRFHDGHTRHAARFQPIQFDEAPPPTGLLPEGPTRDFNLMLRDGARGEVIARTLANSMVLLPEAGIRWILYLDSGRATLRAGASPRVGLEPHDAALIAIDGSTGRAVIEGAGELVLVRLYAWNSG